MTGRENWIEFQICKHQSMHFILNFYIKTMRDLMYIFKKA